MLVPLFNLVTHRPDLIIDHLSGYLKLAQDELAEVKQQVTRRAVASAVALIFAIAFIVLAGVALMLASISTQSQLANAPTVVLIAVPAIALVAAIIAAVAAVKAAPVQTSASFADHVQRDIQAFRQVIRKKEDNA